MIIHKSSEDYLEAMLMMQEKHGFIRSVDVAEQLGVTKPSVSYSTKRLREAGYISFDGDSRITLTDEGLKIARHIYERHKALTDFFVHLGVNEKTAREDACRVEHDLSDETFNAICEHAKKSRQ
ncbi:MAG: metal-dependent transcriptional regulator [Eubacteriaceae bacterium]|nr:metal-dependent transcriptional regulator [Eubacteriaceae bacterium]